MDTDITGISNIANPIDTTQLSEKDQATVKAIQSQQNTPAGGVLGKEEFLNLLVTQLTYQDPMNPMDSTQSIAQLAQFSALEQMQNVNTQIETLRQASGLTDAMFLQGQYIEAMSSDGSTYTGMVEGAGWGTNGLILTIGGVAVPMANIVDLKLVVPASELESEETGTEGESASSSTPVEAT